LQSQALVETVFDDRDWPDPPDVDYSVRRARVSQRFPRLGYYNIASDICGQPGEGNVNVGDAADDLADILGDLSEVVWRWENTSREDAIWHLQLTYRYHWGGHLRSLQLFLYERRNGQPSVAADRRVGR
jgi:hypothetical protein